MPDAMIRAEGLVKIYKTKQTEVLALQGLDLQVDTGELTAIIGNSGSGKSTFLNMIGGLDRPSAGSLFVAGSNLFTMTEKELRRLSRADLLEMLIDQSVELETVKKKLAAAEEALASRVIEINSAGSIAEAALRLNGVFEAAQAACDQYVQNINLLNERKIGRAHV